MGGRLMMRFHLGPVPEGDFEPDPGWQPLDEPAPDAFLVKASYVAGAAGMLFVPAWYFLTPLQLQHLGMPSAGTIAMTIPAFALLIIVHELLHAVFHPRFGTSPQTVIGLWPKHGVFYAHYKGEIGRNRFITLMLTPFIVISVLPLIAAAVFDIPSTWAAGISILNAMLACGDLLGASMIARQVPASAVVRNHGWRSYWRPLTAPRGHAHVQS
jgi:hypothetical protein